MFATSKFTKSPEDEYLVLIKVMNQQVLDEDQGQVQGNAVLRGLRREGLLQNCGAGLRSCILE